MHAFRDIEIAAYCPRKLYYRKRQPPDERDQIPDIVEERRALAFEYERLLADHGAIKAAPIEVTPTQYRSRLGSAKARLDCWEQLCDPRERDAFLSGRECHGVAHKLLDESPALSLVFTGKPPECGVWEPQSVRLMAAAKALSWERESTVDAVIAEYPAYGVVRRVDVTGRRTAAYREAVRTAGSVDGPPSRVDNRAKCDGCEFRDECGVRTRSLRSLLGV